MWAPATPFDASEYDSPTDYSLVPSSPPAPFMMSPTLRLNEQPSVYPQGYSPQIQDQFQQNGQRNRSGSDDSRNSGDNDAYNQNPGRYKTELCHSWAETQTCRYGHKCQFAHGENELRRVDRHPKFKSEKCLAPNTRLLLGDGTICNAVDLKIGDVLVGDDGKTRQVQSVWQGEATLFSVKIQENTSLKHATDEEYKCTPGHTLVVFIPVDLLERKGKLISYPKLFFHEQLQAVVPVVVKTTCRDEETAILLEKERRECGDIVWEVSAESFLQWSCDHQNMASKCRMRRVSVEKYPLSCPIDLYSNVSGFMSLFELGWLFGTTFCKCDSDAVNQGEIDRILATSIHVDLFNSVVASLSGDLCAVLGCQSRALRRGIIGGCLDACRSNTIELAGNYVTAVQHVARSLGFGACIVDNSIVLSGKLSSIPVLHANIVADTDHSPLLPFTITPPHGPKKPFIGVSISGNGRFLLSDFSVCHNCKAFHQVGQCPYGSRCRFIHTKKRTVPAQIEALQASNIFTMSIFMDEEEEVITPSPLTPPSPALSDGRRLPVFSKLIDE